MSNNGTVTPEVREDSPRLEVRSEPFTYRPDSDSSYFRDLIDAGQGDFAAKTRLRRHESEIGDELERRDREALAAKPSELEFRVNPNRTPGQGGTFAPPLWLIDHFATAPRAPRVLADEMPNLPLPTGVGSVSIPRITTGLATQSDADNTPIADQDVVDAQETSAVVTIAGQGDVSQQLLDQSPQGAHLDFVFFRELEAAYNAQLETQLINGNGTGKATDVQLSGLLVQVPSGNAVTYTTGSPTATGMFASVGQMVARIGNNRKLPPELWLLTTSRLAWIATSEDLQSRPLMLANIPGPGQFELATFPGRPDDAIPTTLGAGSNQDVIVLCRPSDMLLLESAPRTSVVLGGLSGTLQVRLQLHRYVAAFTGRYPSGIATLQGTGLVVQTGF